MTLTPEGYRPRLIDKKLALELQANVLNRLYLLADQPAFNPNMRSSVRVGKSVKRHLADPSLAAALLGATPTKLIGNLNTFGFLFEALCERDLRI